MRYPRTSARTRGYTPIADTSRLAWQGSAGCRGEDLALFFAPDGEQPPARDIRELKAKKICQACPVVEACREHALTRPEKAGVWGGMGEEQLKNARRRRARQAREAA